jgi:hypothetical protein
VFLAAARRFGILLVGLVVVTAAVSALLGLAAGASLNRAISIGFYLVGCFLLIAGFFIGNRGPARLKGSEAESGGALGGMFGIGGSRRLRWATPEEREEAISNSAVFVSLGFALILIGVIADNRFRLF